MSNSEKIKKIDQGVKDAIATALLRHKKLGQAIAIWKDGKVVVVPASKIKVPRIKRARAIKKP